MDGVAGERADRLSFDASFSGPSVLYVFTRCEVFEVEASDGVDEVSWEARPSGIVAYRHVWNVASWASQYLPCF